MNQIISGKSRFVKSIKVTDLGIWVTYAKNIDNETTDRFIPASQYGELTGIVREFIARVLE